MATKSSKTAENRFAQYKANKTWEKNRKLRLERTIRDQPNNEQAKSALKGMVYRRKTPGPHGWSATEKRAAQLYKQFSGTFSRDIFHADPKVSQPALLKSAVQSAKNKTEAKTSGFFALGARLQGNWK